MAAAGDKPVTFRTLDIGGDKVLPYMRNVEEENPALGWRAIRLGLDRPGLLRSQIRALLRAGGGRGLKLMFPMIATVEEFDEAKALVEREADASAPARPQAAGRGSRSAPWSRCPRCCTSSTSCWRRVDFLSVGFERPAAVLLRRRPRQ